MKVVVLYKPNSEHARSVDEFEHEFTSRTPHILILEDADSIDGTADAQLYDVMEFPTVVVARDDGQLVKSWTGLPLPLVNDVVGYLVA